MKKLAKIKYLPNNFQIVEQGDYVECAQHTEKKINLEDLTYWNVELQEPYFSYATFFAGSTPIAFNPNLFIGSKNIPSLLPISTKTEFLLRFKSVFNSFASSIK